MSCFVVFATDLIPCSVVELGIEESVSWDGEAMKLVREDDTCVMLSCCGELVWTFDLDNKLEQRMFELEKRQGRKSREEVYLPKPLVLSHLGSVMGVFRGREEAERFCERLKSDRFLWAMVENTEAVRQSQYAD
jgi:hypothetical protein